MALERSGLELVAENAAGYIGDIGKAASATDKFAGGLTQAAGQAAAAAGGIGQAAQNSAGLWQDAAGKWRTASGQFASAAEQAAAGVGRAAGEVSGATGRMAGESGGHFRALEEVARGVAQGFGNIAAEAAVAAGQAVVAFAATSVTAAGDFEAAVNNLAAVSGSALGEAGFSLEDVSAKALQLGQDTRYGASEAITAMTELVKGGLPVAEVMEGATDATLNLAAAAGVDLANAAEIVAKQYGVWADTGVGATEITDLLTQAANASVVGVEDMALGLANAGGTAKTAGVEFNELAQTMALIAPSFSSAADAGTSLKTFLSRLIPTTEPARQAMYDLGLMTFDTARAMETLRAEGIEPAGTDMATLATQVAQLGASMGLSGEKLAEFVAGFDKSVFYDATGSFAGMEQAAQLLHTATAGLSEEQRLLAFNTIFGSDAIRAAAAIAEAGGEGYAAMGAQMAAAGTAAEVAAIQNQGFNFAMDSLMGSIETLQIQLGGYLLPILTQVINEALIPGISAVQAFAATAQDAGLFSVEFAEHLGTIHPALQPLWAAVSEVAAVIGANLVPILGTLAAVAGGTVVGALVAAAASFAPLIAVIGGAIAIGAALYAGWQANFGGVQQAVAAALAATAGVVQSVVSTIRTFWDQNGAQITAATQRWWNQTQQIVSGVVTIISTVITKTFGGIQSFIANHGSQIQSVLQFAWNSIQNVINLAMTTAQGIITTVLGIIQGDWNTAAEGVKTIVGGLGTYVTDQFNNLKGLITALGPSLLDGALSVGKAIVDGIAQGIQNGAGAILNAAKEAARNALNAAKSALGIKSPSQVFADEVGKPVSEGFAEGVLAGIPAALAAVGELADKTKEQALKDFEKIGQEAAKQLNEGLAGRAGLLRGRSDALETLRSLQKEQVKLQAEVEKNYGGDPAELRAAQQALAQTQGLAAQMQTDLQAAQAEAARLGAIDPTAASEFLAKRQVQIRELADLQREGFEATSGLERELLNQQIELTRQRQAVELEQLRNSLTKRAEDLRIGDEAKETGDAMIDGIVQAFQARGKELSSSLTEAMLAAIESTKAALGIQSPSQVMAREVGGPMVEGIAAGFGALADRTAQQIAGMAGQMVRPAITAVTSAPVAAMGGGTTNNYYQYQPTYASAPRAPTQDFAVMRSLYGE